jgi:acetyl-CoA acetyltransferase
VGHADAPQAGVPGLVTVSSIDVAFISGGAQVGWAAQAIPGGNAAMVLGNGTAELTAIAGGIYLSGHWAPDCRVQRVYWLPGDHS